MKQRSLRVAIDIDREEYLRVYRGTAKTVLAYTIDGLSIQFPVNILQQFVEHSGIHGEFIIYVDDNNKFKSIEKIKSR